MKMGNLNKTVSLFSSLLSTAWAVFLLLSFASCQEVVSSYTPPESPNAEWVPDHGLGLQSTSSYATGQDWAPLPPVTGTIPATVSLKDQLGPITDQGTLNACLSHAVAAIKTAQERWEEGWPLDESRQLMSATFLYNSTNQGENRGNSFENVLAALKTSGIASQATCPNSSWDFWNKPSAAAKAEAEAYIIRDWAPVEPSLATLKQFLYAGYPLLVGLKIYTSFGKVNAANPVYQVGLLPTYVADHAVVLCGYDDSTKRFFFRNSWGSGFGVQGIFQMDYEDFLKVQTQIAVLYDAANPEEEPPVEEKPTPFLWHSAFETNASLLYSADTDHSDSENWSWQSGAFRQTSTSTSGNGKDGYTSQAMRSPIAVEKGAEASQLVFEAETEINAFGWIPMVSVGLVARGSLDVSVWVQCYAGDGQSEKKVMGLIVGDTTYSNWGQSPFFQAGTLLKNTDKEQLKQSKSIRYRITFDRKAKTIGSQMDWGNGWQSVCAPVSVPNLEDLFDSELTLTPVLGCLDTATTFRQLTIKTEL